MIQLLSENPLIRLVASEATWIEGEALMQLKKAAELEGMIAAVGMPDIHPGKGGPVGGVFLTRNLFYPHIIGNDAGCGMGLFQTTHKKRKMKRDKWAAALNSWAEISDDKKEPAIIEAGLEPSRYDAALSSLGGGNHFAELQIVEEVIDESEFKRLGGDDKNIFLLVHSGSRSLGERLYREHTEKFGAGALQEKTEEAVKFFLHYDHAVRWASLNRRLIAERFMEEIGGDAELLLDISHNLISAQHINGENYWLHRKGAAPSDAGPIIIPGSRGTLSYLVLPLGNQEQNLWSVAHGAGRKWNRGSCKGKLKTKWTAADLKRTELGGIVICHDRELLYEEAPQAFKKIDTVIAAMTDCGLIRVIAAFRPIITLKTG